MDPMLTCPSYMLDGYYTEHDTAKFLGLHVIELRQMRKKGGKDGPAFYKEGGEVRYLCRDAWHWMTAHYLAGQTINKARCA